MYRKIFFGYLLLLLATFSSAQDIQVKGYFLEDSIRIGVGSPYVLTCTYPSELDIVFPDSLYDFTPYELGEKWFASTKSAEGISYDSAVYYLLSFEIDTAQYNSLPVYQIVGNDSITISPEKDSIFLQQMVTEIPDSVSAEAMPLIENTDYRYVDLALNYPYLIAGILIIIILLIVSYFIFGKSIRIWFKLRRIQKRHIKFLEKFEDLISRSKNEDLTEKIAFTWKAYLEKLEGKPYTKMTTKELLTNDYMSRIEDTLKAIDRSIYGKKHESIQDTFNILLTFSINRFEDKVNEIKHG